MGSGSERSGIAAVTGAVLPRSKASGTGLPREWGSGCGGQVRERVIGGVEALPEAAAERAVIDGAPNLQQPVGTAPRPAHVLRCVHPAVHQEVGRAFGQCRTDPQSGPVPLAVVNQPVALPEEADISRWKRVIGDGLRSQTDRRQATEVAIAATVLNHMLELGRPEYVRIA